jgi:hypothetical protein
MITILQNGFVVSKGNEAYIAASIVALNEAVGKLIDPAIPLGEEEFI